LGVVWSALAFALQIPYKQAFICTLPGFISFNYQEEDEQLKFQKGIQESKRRGAERSRAPEGYASWVSFEDLSKGGNSSL